MMNHQTDTSTSVFERAFQRFKEAKCYTAECNDRPSIYGGRFKHIALRGFLGYWRIRWETMEWRMWESIDEIQFTDDLRSFDKTPGEQDPHDLLQRAEIFGNGGHLSLRKDNGTWFWRYIGTESITVAEIQEPTMQNSADFWAENPTARLRCYPEEVLLWGEYRPEEGIWWDDRVGRATLKYPDEHIQGRAALKFQRYTQDGTTAFIWYQGLEERSGFTEESKI